MDGEVSSFFKYRFEDNYNNYSYPVPCTAASAAMNFHSPLFTVSGIPQEFDVVYLQSGGSKIWKVGGGLSGWQLLTMGEPTIFHKS